MRANACEIKRSRLNLYAYCNGNPVIYVDPSGNYYVVQNANGTYSVVPYALGQAFLSGAASAVPLAGGFLSDMVDYAAIFWIDGEVVGGTSMDNSMLLSDGIGGSLSFIASFTAKKLGEKVVGNSITGFSAVYTLVSKDEMASYDRTIMGLMDIYGMPNSFDSLDNLMNYLSKLDSIISSNPDYFRSVYPSYLTYGHKSYGGYSGSQFLKDYAIYKLPANEQKDAILRQNGISALNINATQKANELISAFFQRIRILIDR